MKKDHDRFELFASYLYKLEEIEHVSAGQSFFQREASMHTLLLFKEAAGEIIVDGQICALHRQKVFLAAPGASLKLVVDPGRSTDYYQIRFRAVQAAENRFVPVALDGPIELAIAIFEFLSDKAGEIERKLRSKDSWDRMKANILFQEMICVLFKDTLREQSPSPNQTLDLTLDYMEQHYHEGITRNKLAVMAGMSADYYSRAFKKKVGKSPMEYLTDIRINQAKQSLVLSRDSFRTIAHSVGFSDEFYFSRKFKAATGRSPSAYVNKIKYSEKIASLKHLLTGHLVALGIEPYAAVINNGYPVTTQFRNTIAIGGYKPDLEKLMTAQPDLIVTCEFRDFEKSQKEKMFDQIAPTITLPFFQDWRIHFQSVARIVGKEKEAGEWLERYDYKAERTRKQVSRKVGDETMLIVGIGEDSLCIYGQRNLGTVLYGDLQLNMPEGVAEIRHYREITPEELAGYDADRILLTSHKHDGTREMDEAIRRQAEALFASRRWKELKAVRGGKVYDIYNTRHLYTCYTSLSHDLLLDKTSQLIGSDSSSPARL
ncbi:AraC family transcriptional regulator [Paenibacillus sepulcri]|uniref:AraC family transcriptional regulator n=1 Tax=Paenibacillus sepulcri TaxID=359917 RepID=A0ABS7C255_9BACL|nr:AraC family transcriptional regulator [Paenibacillus sepulcri]